jgi:cytochrome c-type biogenesis protein CcmH
VAAVSRGLHRFLLGFVLLAAGAAFAAVDIEAPADPELARQYRALIAELRCPKCLNQNIAGSDSPISADLRRTVREQLIAGRTPAQIREYLVARYGDFILYRPRLTASTALLWFGPALALLGGALWLAYWVRAANSAPEPPPDPEALARLRAQLADRSRAGAGARRDDTASGTSTS